MRSNLKLGQVVYWLMWPALFLYLNKSQRSRVILVSGQKVLVVRSWLGNGKWSLPGGGIHKGESAENSVVRELKEETNLDLKPADLKFLSEEELRSNGFTTNLHYFSCVLPTPQTPKAGKPEIISAAWLDIKDLDDKVAGSDVLRGLQIWQQTGHFATIEPAP